MYTPVWYGAVMKCGTYAGYKVHRKLREAICGPCRVAMNEYRQEYHKRKPEKNAQYRRTYINKPEMVAAREAVKQARLEKRRAKAEAKQRAKLIARLHRAMVRHQKATALKSKLKKTSRESHNLRKEIESTRILIWKFNRLGKRLAREAEKAKTRRETLERREARVREKIEKKQSRELQQRKLANQHGTSVADYQRCKKTNGTACDPCRAAAAAYIRNKVKNDPSYREKAKQCKKRTRKGYNNAERARKKGVPRKYYTREHIFKRDGYNCHICNTAVDLTANHIVGQPNWELYPHIDHVIPISKGGPDTLDNVKIAHAKCNLLKGDSLDWATV